MYDELVKRLRNRRICIQQLGTLNDYPLLGEAADAIEELSRENESLAKSVNEASEILRKRWIPVTERLPDENEDVLVYGEWTGISGTKYRDILLSDLKSLLHQGYKLIAWMPLPEPPKEESYGV